MLTSREVAAALGVSPKRARQLLQQGRIPGATKIGRDWLAPEPLRVILGKRGPKPQAKSVAPTGRRQDFEQNARAFPLLGHSQEGVKRAMTIPIAQGDRRCYNYPRLLAIGREWGAHGEVVG